MSYEVLILIVKTPCLVPFVLAMKGKGSVKGRSSRRGGSGREGAIDDKLDDSGPVLPRHRSWEEAQEVVEEADRCVMKRSETEPDRNRTELTGTKA